MDNFSMERSVFGKGKVIKHFKMARFLFCKFGPLIPQGMKKILVTGAAGFIGFHLSKRLTSLGFSVLGVDNLTPYYDVRLKQERLKAMGVIPAAIDEEKPAQSTLLPGFQFIKLDLSDRKETRSLFDENRFSHVVHLAAQPGVRESLRNPYQYIDSNINGLITVLEGCRHHPVEHLLIASSSSVYGNNEKVPFSEDDYVDHPVSLYAATKKSGELMAYTYAHLYGTPTTSLRFFTVYGPWGRPDMAYYKFVKAIEHGETIEVYNQGDLYRDFTYVDDVVDGIVRLLDKSPTEKPPCKVLNIGNSSPVKLMDFIGTIESLLDKKAALQYLPMQAGDVFRTYADVDRLDEWIGYKPQTSIKEGLTKFIDWYRAYHAGEKP
jgi:UDP-glucuronate 4-epimerase